MSTLKLEIVTPESKVYSEDVDMVTLPGVEGEMGIYPMHVPLMTQLVSGEVVVRKGGQNFFLAVGDGFVEITDEFALENPSQDITLSLMTPLEPAVAAPGKINLGNAALLFNADVLTAKVEPIQLDDVNLQRSWGSMLYRVLLRPTASAEKGAWSIRLARKE